MAAYAALVSLSNIVEQARSYNARCQVFNNEQQRQLGSIHQEVSFLQDFLESHLCAGSQEEESLKSRMQDTAYDAEDIIESHIVDDIHARSSGEDEKRSSNHVTEGLHKVIMDMKSIKQDVMKIKEGNKVSNQISRYLVSVDTLRPLPTTKNAIMEFGDDLIHIMDKLTGQQSNLRVIPITGMGGIGKTTLAKNVYANSYVVQNFDVCGWVTVSQEYNEQGMLLALLQCLNGQREHESLEDLQLGLKIHKQLFGRRYLIVMDDIWSIEAWDKLKLFLPNNNNGSRVVITTRLMNVADSFSLADVHKMSLLDENESWRLLCQKVFGHESCPPGLEEIGRRIAKNCSGLPLSIAVIGGLIAKSNMTREYWEYVAKNTNTAANSEDDERCLKVLYMSYEHLPVHLKPCFLYMGFFEEDSEIRVSDLIKLWVAEGFLRPNQAKSLEKVGEDNLKDLINRNLVLVNELGCTGNIKSCKMHDLVRDLCIREAQKEKFFCIIREHNRVTPTELNSQRRIAIDRSVLAKANSPHLSRALQTSSPRSVLIGTSRPYYIEDFQLDATFSCNFKLLRVWNMIALSTLEAKFLNARYMRFSMNSASKFLSSLNLFWNLQTLYIEGSQKPVILPSEIWDMSQLRHLRMNNASLPDPPNGRMSVLGNLQTLSNIVHFRGTEEVIQKIPNVKKLKLRYPDRTNYKDSSRYCLNNLVRLHKLQSLMCRFLHDIDSPTRDLNFPLSLKKLTLCYGYLNWEDVATKIGSLPHLEKLKIIGCCRGKDWNTVEGQFLSLKFMQIVNDELERWTTDDTHFPRLEQLHLTRMDSLEEIPSCIGYITTLELINLNRCKSCFVDSTVEMVEEQHDLGNGLRLLVDEIQVLGW